MEAITQIFLVMMVWAVAAAWIFALVNMAITGDVHPGEALAGSLIALAAGVCECPSGVSTMPSGSRC